MGTTWIDNNVPWFVREVEAGDVYTNIVDDFRELPILTIYIDYENKESKNEIINSLEQVADSFRQKILFTYMNGNNEKYSSIFNKWGYDGTLPIMMLVAPYTVNIVFYI